jgi:hypothetical protein
MSSLFIEWRDAEGDVYCRNGQRKRPIPHTFLRGAAKRGRSRLFRRLDRL